MKTENKQSNTREPMEVMNESEQRPILRAFPWGICVGALTSPGATQNRPAMLPTASGGLLVRFGLAGQNVAVSLIEIGALSIVDAFPPRGVEIHVIDYAIRKRFPNLSALAPLRQYRLHDNRRGAEGALDDFEATARYRHHELLSDETPTLSDFNRKGRGRLEPYRILVLNLNDCPGDDVRERARLLTMLDAAFDAGIYVIAFVNTDTLPPPPADRPNPPPPFWTLLAQRYPQAFLTGQEAIELIPDTHTQPLLDILAASGMTLGLPRVDLSALLERRRQLDANNEGHLRDFLDVPIGVTPDGRSDISFRLGAKSDCNSAFMVGMARSGKTTLLNNLIVGIAERYSSDEVRLYLMDYKEGVEFQAFSGHPNCEKIFLDNKDLDAAVHLMESFVGEIDRRAALFREAKANNLDAYHAGGAGPLPRLLLIVDEVQRLLTDDARGRAFNERLTDVVRRGGAFGVHLLLSTQTLINATIGRDLMAQIALRIAFRLGTDSDCDRIFNYGNLAPRTLDRFEFIINTNAGSKEANIRARALPPPEIEHRLSEARARRHPGQCLTPEIVTGVTKPETQSSTHTSTVKMPTVSTDWLKSDSSTEYEARCRRDEDLLARVRSITGGNNGEG